MHSRHIWSIPVVLLLVAGVACVRVGRTGATAGAGADRDDEVAIALDQLPAQVRAAALAAVPGLVIEEAARETENGVVLYDVEGEVGGQDYELEITADGRVLEVEREADDDADDADEDEDDADD